MTIKHIQDQIENYAEEVARVAYLLGLKHAGKLYSKDKKIPNNDEIKDLLKTIVKNKLKGD